MSVEIYSDYQLDRAWKLGGVHREFELVKSILKNYPEGVNVPINREKPDARFFITPRVAFGMYLCQRSLYDDLINDNMPMLALDLIGSFR